MQSLRATQTASSTTQHLQHLHHPHHNHPNPPQQHSQDAFLLRHRYHRPPPRLRQPGLDQGQERRVGSEQPDLQVRQRRVGARSLHQDEHRRGPPIGLLRVLDRRQRQHAQGQLRDEARHGYVLVVGCQWLSAWAVATRVPN